MILERMLKEDPKCAESRTLVEEPIRNMPLADKVDPKAAKSSCENELPQATLLKMESDEPWRILARRESEEAMLR